jgi:type VI secretion system protein ImpC
MSNVAAAFAPFISAASRSCSASTVYRAVQARDLEKIFDSLEYAKWRRISRQRIRGS